jgi:HEAT repeat protein
MRRLTTLALVALCLLSVGFEWEGRLGRLRRDLSSGDAARRREVVRLLGSYPAAEVGDAILGALDDPDAGVRAEAADAAGRVRLREAVPRLLDWLDDGDADVRTSAARALGRIGDTRTVTPLVRVLGDSNADVRKAAVQALASIGTPDVVVPLLGRLDDVNASVRIEAAEVLGALGDSRAVVPLVGRARDDAPEVRMAVYAALGEIGDSRGLAALLMGLRDPVTDSQLVAIAALGRLGAESAVEPLVAALSDPDPRRGRAVVAALGSIEGEAAARAVADALAHPRTRALAADVLVSRARRLGRESPEEREAFVMTLASSLSEARSRGEATAIASVLSRILADAPVASAAGPLLDALASEVGNEGQLLTAAAATGAPEVLVPILARLREDDEGAIEASLDALERYFERAPPDGRAADPLLSALGRVPHALRARVVHLLGIVGARRALPELRPLLDHPDRRLRRVAVEAIGAIGDPEGAEAILALLDDRDGRTRFEAARALGAAAGPDTVAALVDELAANEPKDRHAIIEALGAALARLDEAAELDDALAARAREGLAAAARAEDDQLAARAIDALGRWGADEGAPVLASLFTHHHPPRRRAAAHALGGIESDASRAALRRALSGDDETMKAAAAVSLGTVGTSEDVPAIVALARGSRWPTQGAAAFALARLARRGVASADALGPALCELSQKRGPYVRANVATAMAALGLGACPEGPAPADWLDNRRAAPVQAAAARWLAAAAAAGNADPDEARHALDACMDRALSDEVSATCASPGLPALDDEADIYAWSADGRTLLRDRLVALRLSDGSVMLGRTDDNGHVRLGRAPAGRLVLDDPAATPLEPAQNAD